MTRVLPRANFNSSKLMRCLTDMAMVDAVEPGVAFAEKLGLWVRFTDASVLYALHDGSIARPQKKPLLTPTALRVAVGVEFDRTRCALECAITKACTSGSGQSPMVLPEPHLALPMDLAAAFAPYRWFYEGQQRTMESLLSPLRSNVRDALAKASATLGKLASIDAAFERILRDREGKLLTMVPGLLKKRFDRLFEAHRQALSDTGQADDPARWMQPDAWLARFCNDLHTLLLAELDFRLQPMVGLIEAFHHETEHA